MNCGREYYSVDHRALYLKIGLGATAKIYEQLHFSDSENLITTHLEYPGWMIDTLAA
jgi:hypothetical protein